ncbi:DUF7310 family coiled-coil domain-containing protein [Halorubrum pallidum]
MTETTRSDDRRVGDEDVGDGTATDRAAASRGRRLDERLRAVERALTGSDAAVSDIADGAEATAERREIGSRLSDLETRVEELEAATQALRGYVGAVRAVNAEVERRADLALARTSREQVRDAADTVDPMDPVDADLEGDTEPRSDGAGEVPTASALDAAVPSDSGGGERGTRFGEGTERGDTDGSGTTDGSETISGCDGGRSWGRNALDRLRDSV